MRQTQPKSLPPTPPRGRAFVSLLACLLVVVALAAISVRAQQQGGANSQQQQPTRGRTKRLTPLRAAESAQGSRVTITSDGELNDYSAYRSGDRFIVVIPQAEGGGDGGVRGRGFEGAQVTRRGDDLVYTFKLEPGSTARVNQRFNRLDVQFIAPKQSAQGGESVSASAPAPTPRTPPELSGARPQPSPAASATPAARSVENGNLNAGLTGRAATPAGVTTPVPSEAPPVSPTPVPSPAVAGASPSPAPSAATPAPAEVAQVLPTPAPPVVTVPSTSTPAATTSTLGATLVRNWPWIIAALLIVGLGLLFVARFGDRASSAAAPVGGPSRAEPLKERAELHGEKETPALEGHSAAPVPPAEGVAERADAVESAPSAPTAATTAAAAATLAATATKKEKGKKKKSRETSPGPKVEAAKSSSVKTEAPPHADESEAGPPPADFAPPAAPETKGVTSVEAEEPEFAPAPDMASIGEEVRKLLTGDSYDESIINARDAATRQLVAAELSAALMGRNRERNKRAREAFLKHGYFKDAARDLQSAEAPAQRAAAARNLSLLRDRAAMPHLVAALEDPSAEVRRAGVEALAELGDPAARGPLEALRWRETSRQVPRSLIQRAVDACTPAHPPEVAEELVESDETLVSETIAPHQPALESAPAVAAETPTETDVADVPVTGAEIAPAVSEAQPSATPATGAHAAELALAEETRVGEPVSGESTAVGTLTDEVSATEAPTTEASLGKLSSVGGVEGSTAEVIESSSVEAPTIEASTVAATTAEARLNETPPAEVPAAESEAVAQTERASAGELTTPSAEPTPEGKETQTLAVPVIEEREAVEAPAATEEDTTAGESARLDASPVAPVAEAESHAAEAEESTAARAPKIVYTFDENDAASWVGRRGSVGAGSPEEAGGVGRDAAREAGVAEFDGAEQHVYLAPEFATSHEEAVPTVTADDWIDVDVAEHRPSFETEATQPPAATARVAEQIEHSPALDAATEKSVELFGTVSPDEAFTRELARTVEGETASAEKGIEEFSIIPKSIQVRLESEDVAERAASVRALAHLNTDEAFRQICAAFEDSAPEVRDSAARALYELSDDRAESFTRALRESAPDRRRRIGAALASSGLAEEAVGQLTGKSREKTYDAFSLLFLMAKAGETAPLIRAIESHPDSEVRLAVVKLLALSGQQEVLPSFKRLAVRGSLPTEVRSAVMEAIYQISSSQSAPKPTSAS